MLVLKEPSGCLPSIGHDWPWGTTLPWAFSIQVTLPGAWLALAEPEEKCLGIVGRRKPIVLFAILVSISLALQGQPGSQSPRGPWLNLSLFLFSPTVCLSPDLPRALVIPGMTLVFIKQPFESAQAGRPWRGCAVSARSGDGSVRAPSRNCHEAWPRKAPPCASKHTCVCLRTPALSGKSLRNCVFM